MGRPRKAHTPTVQVTLSSTPLFPPPEPPGPDHLRRSATRAAFMEELLKDQRVRELFERWGQQTGLSEAWSRYEATHDAMAVAMKSRTPSTRLARQLAAAEATLRRCSHRAFGRLPSEAQAFVRDGLGLPWSWVAPELLAAFGGFSPGLRWRHDWAFHPGTAAAEFVGPGDRETEQEARGRLKREYLRVDAELRAIFARRAARDRMLSGRVATYARWFYRHRLRGESIRSLAREYHEQKRHVCAGDDRPTVRRGIAEAARRLGLDSSR